MMKSVEEIFAIVRAHLLSQGAVSEDEHGSCRLRGGDGRRCATGALIDDAHYTEDLEGLGIGYYKAGHDGPLLQALMRSGVDAYDPRIRSMLISLDDMHDCVEPHAWPAQLDAIARRHAIAAVV